MAETKAVQTVPTLADIKVPTDVEKLIQKGRPIGVFESKAEFDHAQRVGKMLMLSQLMPEHFRGEANLGSVVVVLDIAFRMKLNPLLVAQQIYLVYGKPGFSAQFMIAVMNSNADFGKLRFEIKPLGKQEVEYVSNKQRLKATIEDRQCVAWALEGKDLRLPEGVNTLEKAKDKGLAILEGPPVSITMAVKEGWYGKDGSKWQTLPDLMLRYRAASFFGRLYAPELMMGLSSVEELQDLGPPDPTFAKPIFASATTTPGPVLELALPEAKEGVTPTEIPPEPSKRVSDENKPTESAPAPITKHIRELCERDGLKIENVLDFLIAIGSVKEETTSLEQVHLKHPNVLAMVVNQWPDISKRIKEAK